MSVDQDFENALGGQLGSMEEFFTEGKTVHAADAIDFEDEDELADEEEPTHSHGNNDQYEEEEEEEDFMKELQTEALEGVENGGDAEIAGSLLGLNMPDPNANVGLQDLDFASNTLLDHTVQVGESDIDLSGSEDVEDNEYKEEQRKAIIERSRLERAKKKEENKEKLLRIFCPTFKKGKSMKLQTLFPILPLEFSYQIPQPVKGPLMPKTLQFEIQADTRKGLRMTNKHYRDQQTKQLGKGLKSLPPKQMVEIKPDEFKQEKETVKAQFKYRTNIKDYDHDIILSAANWDDDAIIMGGSEDRPTKRLKIGNFTVDDWVDDDEMIFNGSIDIDLMNLKLDLNDEKMVLMDKDEDEDKINVDESLAMVPMNQKVIDSKFSISNDMEYEFLKGNYQIKVRATIGTMTIDHAPPAARLQTPYYKVKPPAKNVRLYHRPKFSVRSGTLMQFSRPRHRKKKKDRGKDITELFKESKDLTLGDTGNIFVLEYSEEFPLSMSKFGMGSKIINYYRKIHDDDTKRPKFSIGETHVLGVQDRSPFWNFGFVESGNVIPALYNHMIRAPVYQHESYSTDFLLVRSHGGGSNTRYFLRSINQLFTVGQCYPAQEVPGPHSRRVTTVNKNRLKMIVYRAVNNNPRQRIVVKDISVHFPDQTDMQNRQKLKEFMEYQRHGEDQGHWKVKSSDMLLDYDQIRKLVTPDDICLMEMMLMGQQRFDDLESFRRERLQDLEEGNKKEPTKESEEDLAHKLAPWNTTKNFIQATQGKAMLQIHGEGDPSHKGEAISFLRTSMKGGFLKNVENSGSGSTPVTMPTPTSTMNNTPGTPTKNGQQPVVHSYNVAQQQRLYDDEIAKVWYKQRSKLSKSASKSAPASRTDDDFKDVYYMKRADKIVNKEVDEKPRYLKITRLVKNEYGIKERKVVVIKDPKVVELYVKRKQQQLVEGMHAGEGDIVLTNDTEENLKVKKRLEEELAKLQKIHEKKKKKVPMITAANIDSEGRISGKGIGKGKSTLRRCATCGALGHIRTNKTCPLYYTVHNKSNPNYNGSTAKSNPLANLPPSNNASTNKTTTTANK